MILYILAVDIAVSVVLQFYVTTLASCTEQQQHQHKYSSGIGWLSIIIPDYRALTIT